MYLGSWTCCLARVRGCFCCFISSESEVVLVIHKLYVKLYNNQSWKDLSGFETFANDMIHTHERDQPEIECKKHPAMREVAHNWTLRLLSAMSSSDLRGNQTDPELHTLEVSFILSVCR